MTFNSASEKLIWKLLPNKFLTCAALTKSEAGASGTFVDIGRLQETPLKGYRERVW